MNLKRNPKNQAATSFLEYVLILGVASAVLMGMSTYVKRGMQGRLKEMTDYFISNEQLVEINPTTSNSNTLSKTTLDSQSFRGGGKRQTLADTKEISSKSSVKYREPIFIAPLTSTKEGEVSPVVQPK